MTKFSSRAFPLGSSRAEARELFQLCKCVLSSESSDNLLLNFSNRTQRNMRIFWLILILCFCAYPSSAQSGPQSTLMPMPSSIRPGTGALPIDGSFSVALEGYREPRIDRAVQRFLHNLSRVTGIPIRNQIVNHANATLLIRAEHASKPIQDVGEDEGYTLDLGASGAKLTAPNPLGIMHGLQTFLQLVIVTPDGFGASAVHIEDSPRFPWRGLTIDVSRHFISVDTLKRNMDGMA